MGHNRTSKLGAQGRPEDVDGWIGGDKRKNRKDIADRSREHGQRSKAMAVGMHGSMALVKREQQLANS